MNKITTIFIGICSLFSIIAHADITIPIHLTPNGKLIGNITASDTKYGLLLTPDLSGLNPGSHGFMFIKIQAVKMQEWLPEAIWIHLKQPNT